MIGPRGPRPGPRSDELPTWHSWQSREDRLKITKQQKAEARRLGRDPFHPRPLDEDDLGICQRCGRALAGGDELIENLNYLGQIYWRQHRHCPGKILWDATQRSFEREKAKERREREEEKNPRWRW